MKRKRIEQSLSLGASIGMLLLLVWGCGQEPADILPASGDPSVPVNISTSIDADILHTRSTVSKGSIGVFLLADAQKIYAPQYNVKYDYNSGWKASVPVYVGTANASLCAYYPYGKVSFEPNTTICTLRAQKNDPGNELFYANSSGSTLVNSNNPNATFNMVRAYADLKLSIKRHEKYYLYSCWIKKVTLKSGDSFNTTCTFDISDGKSKGGNANANGYITDTNFSIKEGYTNNEYDMLVPPQSLESGLTINLNVDQIDRSVIIPVSSFNDRKLASGKQYTINLLITDTELLLNGDVTVEDYKDNSEINNGNDIIIDPANPTIPTP